jgi:hypothetical protein
LRVQIASGPVFSQLRLLRKGWGVQLLLQVPQELALFGGEVAVAAMVDFALAGGISRSARMACSSSGRTGTEARSSWLLAALVVTATVL